MDYVESITDGELRRYEAEGNFLKATRKMIAEMKINFERAEKAEEDITKLKALYESVANLGRDAGVEIEKSMYFFVKSVRIIFMNEF